MTWTGSAMPPLMIRLPRVRLDRKGRPRLKGKRRPTLEAVLTDDDTEWTPLKFDAADSLGNESPRRSGIGCHRETPTVGSNALESQPTTRVAQGPPRHFNQDDPPGQPQIA